MLRVAVALGLVATVGCRQLAPAPAAIERPAAATVVRAASVQADSPRDNTRERASKVRGRPVAWCAEPRRHDPLLLDAIELGTFTENDGSVLDDVRVIHRIPLLPADHIVMVTDEDSCEHAARAYDGAISIYRSSGRAPSIEPVHVVSLGPLYLVESAGDRGEGYEVKLLTRSWKHLRGGFGVEF
ncbi:MAG: hypothetical protein Q7R30_03110 [Acidobacteriota bacterium]|nr:hypothetical protein [Acidobacteriota bacterium]